MSKAFTRESDDEPERLSRPAASSALPPGAKNYMTQDGAQRLRDKLNQLLENRSALSGLVDKATELQSTDAQIVQLQDSLGSAVVVSPASAPWDRVRFGATVTVQEQSGEQSRYRIVGVDESDIDRGWVSWLSPVAKALINGRLGQKVRLRRPAGETELEIVSISYE